MSHLQERKEKNCLNCNAEVAGRFCQICGQENIVPKESFWHLVNHFFQDITHFDGKFFTSLKLLITRPGFLSTEYNRGRRNSYLNPIRMYIFSSAVFFLIFFSLIAPKSTEQKVESYSSTKLLNEFIKSRKGIEMILKVTTDSAEIKEFETELHELDEKINTIKKDSIAGLKYFTEKQKSNFNLMTFDKYQSLQQYDSVQNSLPNDKRDSYLSKLFKRKSLSVNEKYKDNNQTLKEKVLDSFFHKFPQLFFISLPLFALVLRLLYYRRKDLYYVNHIIYSFHLYIFTFIALIILFGLQKINNQFHIGFIKFLIIGTNLGIFIYQYKAMRNFYQQKRFITIVKYLLLNFISLVLIIILFLFFFLLSFFQL